MTERDLLDTFYTAVPEMFANEARTTSVAASNPLSIEDRMWLRGIRAACADYRIALERIALGDAPNPRAVALSVLEDGE